MQQVEEFLMSRLSKETERRKQDANSRSAYIWASSSLLRPLDSGRCLVRPFKALFYSPLCSPHPLRSTTFSLSFFLLRRDRSVRNYKRSPSHKSYLLLIAFFFSLCLCVFVCVCRHVLRVYRVDILSR